MFSARITYSCFKWLLTKQEDVCTFASSIELGTSHYLSGGGRVLKGLGCVTIELDLIPPKTVQHSYDFINCQVIDSKFSIVRHLYLVGDN